MCICVCVCLLCVCMCVYVCICVCMCVCVCDVFVCVCVPLDDLGNNAWAECVGPLRSIGLESVFQCKGGVCSASIGHTLGADSQNMGKCSCTTREVELGALGAIFDKRLVDASHCMLRATVALLPPLVGHPPQN